MLPEEARYRKDKSKALPLQSVCVEGGSSGFVGFLGIGFLELKLWTPWSMRRSLLLNCEWERVNIAYFLVHELHVITPTMDMEI